MKRIVYFAMVFVSCPGTVGVADEDCHRCEECGCTASCCKVCRCVPEVKKVPKTTYACECEDFCVPGRSQRSVVCDECGNKQHVYTPSCAHVRTRKKLVKHETFEEKITYKWVVENLCTCCASRARAESGGGDGAWRPASGAEGQPVAYESVATGQPPAGTATAVADGISRSQARRLFDSIRGGGPSGR